MLNSWNVIYGQTERSYRLHTSYENFRPGINPKIIIPHRGLWIITDLPLTALHLFSRSPDLIFEVCVTV